VVDEAAQVDSEVVLREVEGDSVVVEVHQGDEVVQVVVSEEVVEVTRVWLSVQIFGLPTWHVYYGLVLVLYSFMTSLT
jgi:hypothetical protein